MKCTAAIVSAILAFAAASPLDLPQGVESGAGAAVSSAAGSVPSLGALVSDSKPHLDTFPGG